MLGQPPEGDLKFFDKDSLDKTAIFKKQTIWNFQSKTLRNVDCNNPQQKSLAVREVAKLCNGNHFWRALFLKECPAEIFSESDSYKDIKLDDQRIYNFRRRKLVHPFNWKNINHVSLLSLVHVAASRCKINPYLRAVFHEVCDVSQHV